MIKIEGKVNNPLGLTSRLSADLVAEANRYKCSSTLVINDERADLKSIMNVMALIIVSGTSFTIELEGEDESIAATKFESLLTSLKLK